MKFFLFCMLLTIPVWADDKALNAAWDHNGQFIGELLEFYVDNSENSSHLPDETSQMQSNPYPKLNLGLTEGILWARLVVDNPLSKKVTIYFQNDDPFIPKIDAFRLTENNILDQYQSKTFRLNNSDLASLNTIPRFKFELPPGRSELWFRIVGVPKRLRLRAFSPLNIIHYSKNVTLETFILGIMPVVLIIYHGVYWVFHRKSIYPYYILFLTFFTLCIWIHTALIKLFISDEDSLNLIFRKGIYIVYGLLSLSINLFSRKLVDLHKRWSRYDKFLQWLSVSFLFLTICVYFTPFPIFSMACLILTILAVVSILPVLILSKVNIQARYLAIASIPTIILFFASVFEVLTGMSIPYNLDSLYLYSQAIFCFVIGAGVSHKNSTFEENFKVEKKLHRILEKKIQEGAAFQRKQVENQGEIKNIQFFSNYAPSETIGGDWYKSFYDKEKGVAYYVIGDVTGHGVSAAMLTGVGFGISTLMLSVLGCHSSIKDNLLSFAKGLDDVVFEVGSRMNMNMTMVVVAIELETGMVHTLSAGHCPILIKSKENINFLMNPGNILGFKTGDFTVKTKQLQTEDIIFLYTDGLLENHYKRPSTALRQLRNLFQKENDMSKIEESLRSWIAQPMLEQSLDDTAYIVLKWSPSSELDKSEDGIQSSPNLKNSKII